MTYERVVKALRCPEWHVAVLALAREPRADVDDPALLKPIAKDIRAALAANRGAPALRSAFAGVVLVPDVNLISYGGEVSLSPGRMDVQHAQRHDPSLVGSCSAEREPCSMSLILGLMLPGLVLVVCGAMASFMVAKTLQHP